MNGTVSEIIGIFAALVVVAGLTVMIVNGGNTARIIGATGDAFSKSIRAATQQK